MRTLGVDLGKDTGYAILDDGMAMVYGEFRLEGSIGERLTELRSRLVKLILNHNVRRVGVENPPYVQNAKTHRQLCAYWGAVLSLCEESVVPYAGVEPGEVKKHATGKGNCGKPAMVAAAKDRWKVNPSENAADALWIASWAEENI